MNSLLSINNPYAISKRVQQELKEIERRLNKTKNKETGKVKRLQPRKRNVKQIMENIEVAGDLRSGRIRSREGSISREGSAVSIRDRERSPSIELMDNAEQMMDSPIGRGISTRYFEGTGQPTLSQQASSRNKDSIMIMLNCISNKVKIFGDNIGHKDKTPSIVEREFLEIDSLCEDFLSSLDIFKHTDHVMFSKFFNKIHPIRDELIKIKQDYNKRYSVTDAGIIDQIEKELSNNFESESTDDLLQVTTVHAAHHDAVQQGNEELMIRINDMEKEMKRIQTQLRKLATERSKDFDFLGEEITKIKMKQNSHDALLQDRNTGEENQDQISLVQDDTEEL